ncbi:hypothetical protein JTE90_002192 [Oedothorax gibbosus]|uniref:Uncharacterized protein n=1 Tax=Oedothorax gibbosus TaxID=931172 RepID=A0AAV6VG23_9ARAC|nr:hypothetical protein JTE90_002192 [Oedothorax gibbosus]
MDPSFCDLEFFDFKDSSDEEIKEIQAILKGPKSEGCVKLPWDTSVKTKCSGNLPPNEGAEAESAEDVVEETPQVLTTTHSALPPPVVALPPAAETYVTLPTTVGPYHNTPYFVSRTLPYLRTYPPMGMPLFACPLPGDASPYGFVPVTPADTEAGFKRQSARRGSVKKRLGSESPESANPYPEGLGCPPTSVPLVPLSVPPPTFVGGNLPLHGYPPGLHTSPAMYYVPVFNHPYGGYIQAPGPPMMLPVNIAATTDLKCPPPVSAGETLPTGNANDSPPRDINGVGFKSPKDNKGSCELTQEGSVGHVDSPQNDLGLTSQTVDLEEKAEQAEIDCRSGEVLVADTCDPALAISAHPPEDSTPVGHTDNTSNSLPNAGDTAAKINVPEHKDITNNKSKSSPSDPPNEDCLPETDNDCPEETVVPLEVPPKDSSSPVIQKTPIATALQIKNAAKKVSLSEVAKPVDHHRPSKCWADLFKRPSFAVNGFESPPEPNGKRNCDPPGKVATGEGRPPRVKRGVSNGKVPSSNSLH